MRALLALGAAAVLAAPLPVLAQDAEAEGEDLAEMTETLRDPMVQAQVAELASAISNVLLDVDLSPMMAAVEDIAEEDVIDESHGTTLREIAPEAEAVPEVVREELPQMLERMAGMGEAMQSMLPALKELGAKMKQAIEQSDISVR